MADMRHELMRDVKCDGKKYEIKIDVHEFDPSEVKVRLVINQSKSINFNSRSISRIVR